MTDPSSAPFPGSDEPDAAGRVSAEMLHEIRNVLNPIVAAAYLLRTHARDPGRVTELAERIEQFARGEQRVADRMVAALARERSVAPAKRVGPAGADEPYVPSSSTPPTR